MKTVLKYLDTFAEQELPRGIYRNAFFPKKNRSYVHCAVIPLYGESRWLNQGLPSLLTAAAQVKGSTLLIGVVNRHELSEPEVRADNQLTLDHFKSFPQIPIPDFPLMTLVELNSQVDLILLNHNEEPHLFSSKEGVGKARKLGCDLALALSTTPTLSVKYIHTTDGDAIVAPDYFSMETNFDSDVLLHPYLHVGDYEQMEALRLYEFSLRHYVAGLKFAGSPYAHESLGSTIAIKPHCYAAVRGFPKRNAAEDFYLLNKAVKTGSLYQSEQGLVRLVGRESRRVPFGTGVGTEKIWQKLVHHQVPTFYHPNCFEITKNVCAVLEQWSQNLESSPNRKEITRTIRGSIEIKDLERLENILDQLGFFTILETAKKQRKSPEAILKHSHESWDGFKTLKFIHGLREYFFPEVTLEEARKWPPSAAIPLLKTTVSEVLPE